VAGLREPTFLGAEVEFEADVLDYLSRYNRAFLDIKLEAMFLAPGGPFVVKNATLGSGGEEEQEVVDVLFLDWPEGDTFFS